ncbi:MAG: alpha/beta fold hydrolase [Chloroflexi bacterium]|nr:alpha/beta fold hydrolase [Chloroflexota bacterium]
MPSWLYVESRLPVTASARPPILMVHGACNGPWVWQAWQEALVGRSWRCYAPALRGHRGGPLADLSTTGMSDYLEDVVALARYLAEPTVVMGWSMGGLLAFMFAALAGPRCRGVIALGPSTTAETQEPATPEALAEIPDTFGPDYYGIRDDLALTMRTFPELTEEESRKVVALFGQESGLARRDRKAGVSIPREKVQSPLLVVAGERDRQFPLPVCQQVADYYRGTLLEVPEASHLGLVMSARLVGQAAERLDAWLRRHVLGERE